MKRFLCILLKLCAIIISWLLLPPIFYYLSYLWYKRNKIFRRIFLFLSPVTVIFIILISYYSYDFIYDQYWHSKWNLENKTGIKFPDYKVISIGRSYAYQHNMHYSYFPENEMVIKLDSADSETFYNDIEKSIRSQNSFDNLNKNKKNGNWTNGFNSYTYRYRANDHKKILYLNVIKTSREVQVEY